MAIVWVRKDGSSDQGREGGGGENGESPPNILETLRPYNLLPVFLMKQELQTELGTGCVVSKF